MGIAAVIEKLKRHKFFSEFLTDKSFTQFKKYLIIGFMSFLLEYMLFLLLLQLAKLNYIISNITVYTVIFWFNFLMNRYWSFKSKDNIGRQLKLYGLLFAFNLLVTTGMIYILSDIAGIIPQISKIIVMGAVVSWNFIIYKKVIYR
jgi:putative flippase GtrA